MNSLVCIGVPTTSWGQGARGQGESELGARWEQAGVSWSKLGMSWSEPEQAKQAECYTRF